MRLNKEIKNDIRTIVMDRAITPKEKALDKKLEDFVLRVFWSQIDKWTYQAWKMSPARLIHENMARNITLRDDVNDSLNVYLSKPVTYPYHPMGTYLNTKSMKPEFMSEYKTLIKELDELNALRDSVETNLTAVLNSVTTVKKLREVWVNGAEVIDKALGMQQTSPTVYMPAIAIQTLDSIVPLP